MVDASGTEVTFSDGTRLIVRSVIWATGFKLDFSWIDLPVFDEQGVVHQRGVTPCPGFYFLGLTWQHTRGSALLGWGQGRKRSYDSGNSIKIAQEI